MATPATFWAARVKNDQQRGSDPVTPEPAKEPDETAPTQASATSKFGSGIIFKPHKGTAVKSSLGASTKSGAAATNSRVTPTIATSWADAVEEDEAQAARPVKDLIQKQEDDNSMLSTVAHQQKRIEVAEATIARQEERIEHLELEIRQYHSRTLDMEMLSTDLEKRISGLEQKADEDRRYAAQLCMKLEEKSATIHKLEFQIAEKFSIPDSDSATEVEEMTEDPTPSQPLPGVLSMPAQPEVLVTSDDVPNSSALTGDVTSDYQIKSHPRPLPEDDTATLSPIDFPALGSPTPLRDLKRSPFVTAENIKKVPPPPPPRTLKLALDPSKFQKKPTTGPGSKFLFGSRRAKEGPPAIDPTKDIRRMSKEEREPFGFGPTVQIMMGNETVAALPKYIFMQVSHKAFAHWSKNPNAQTIKFEAGSVTTQALNIQLDWITMHTHCNRVFSITLKPENDDRFNLELVRCARVLGMHGMYMGHFTRLYCQKVRDGPAKELVALIDELSYTDDEPIFDCLANHLAMQQSKCRPQDLNSFKEQLARHPKLLRKMQDVQGRKTFAMGKTASQVKVSKDEPLIQT